MARPGQLIENPVTGERIRWLVTAEETDGRLVRFEAWSPPGREARDRHVHRRSEERLEVLSGRACVDRDGACVTLGPGEHAIVAPGTPHDWWAAGDDELHVVVELTDPRGFETIVETLYGLARDGRTNDRGCPDPLQFAVMLDHFSEDVRLRSRALAALRPFLARAGRAVGYRPSYPAAYEG